MGRSRDFRFWEDRLPDDHQDCDSSGGSERNFQSLGQVDDQLTTGSHLLPHNHHFSCPSPPSRLQAIMDGRRELMAMIKDMPEASYELSLKDMVDDHRNLEEVEENESVLVEEMKLNHETRTRLLRNNRASSKIYRSRSMDSGVFLLKMFLPASLSSKKKSTSRRRQNICPQPLPNGAEKPAIKDWWKIKFLSARDNKNISRSNSDISGTQSRLNATTQTPCEWSFSNKKSRSTGQRGCLF